MSKKITKESKYHKYYSCYNKSRITCIKKVILCYPTPSLSSYLTVTKSLNPKIYTPNTKPPYPFFLHYLMPHITNTHHTLYKREFPT